MQERDQLPTSPEPDTARLLSPVDIVETFAEIYAAERINEALEYVAPNARYVLHIDGAPPPYGGETVGTPALRELLATFRREFDYVLFNCRTMSASGDTVRQRLEFIYRHRKSGATLSGNARLVWIVRDGLIVDCAEYHDAAMVAAFLNYFAGEPPA